MGKRTMKKSSSPKTKAFRKAVSTIAKKAVMNVAETKTQTSNHTAAFGATGVLWSPAGGGMFASVVKGINQGDRIGDEITSLGVKIRGYVNINNTVITAGYQHCGFRMLLVAGKRPLTTGDLPLFRGAVDPELLTVISDRYVKLTSTNYGMIVNKYIKFKRNVKYVGGTTVKNDLYLWLIPNPEALQTGLTTTAGYVVNVDMQLYYKDV